MTVSSIFEAIYELALNSFSEDETTSCYASSSSAKDKSVSIRNRTESTENIQSQHNGNSFNNNEISNSNGDWRLNESRRMDMTPDRSDHLMCASGPLMSDFSENFDSQREHNMSSLSNKSTLNRENSADHQTVFVGFPVGNVSVADQEQLLSLSFSSCESKNEVELFGHSFSVVSPSKLMQTPQRRRLRQEHYECQNFDTENLAITANLENNASRSSGHKHNSLSNTPNIKGVVASTEVQKVLYKPNKKSEPNPRTRENKPRPQENKSLKKDTRYTNQARNVLGQRILSMGNNTLLIPEREVTVHRMTYGPHAFKSSTEARLRKSKKGMFV